MTPSEIAENAIADPLAATETTGRKTRFKVVVCGGGTSNRVSGRVVDSAPRMSGNSSKTVLTASTTAVAARAGTSHDRDAGRATGVESATCSVSNDPSRISRASPMSRNRFLGSFSRQRRKSYWTAEGVVVGSVAQSGSFVRIADSTSVIVGPPKGRDPVSIS